MEIGKGELMFIGLIINLVGLLYAVMNSKIKQEKRIAILETKVQILMRSSDLRGRRSDDDSP